MFVLDLRQNKRVINQNFRNSVLVVRLRVAFVLTQGENPFNGNQDDQDPEDSMLMEVSEADLTNESLSEIKQEEEEAEPAAGAVGNGEEPEEGVKMEMGGDEVGEGGDGDEVGEGGDGDEVGEGGAGDEGGDGEVGEEGDGEVGEEGVEAVEEEEGVEVGEEEAAEHGIDVAPVNTDAAPAE